MCSSDLRLFPSHDINTPKRKRNMENNGRELRMYFFVPYNISPIQQAIQAGHAMGEYTLKFGRRNPDHIVWEFLEKWKTWIVLNGGTTNAAMHEDEYLRIVPVGDLTMRAWQLNEANIDFATFNEPDLNDALTAVCFIADERMFNKKLYPDFVFDADAAKELIKNNEYNINIPMEEFDKWYDPVIESAKAYGQWFAGFGEGAKDVIFLRSFLKGTKFA